VIYIYIYIYLFISNMHIKLLKYIFLCFEDFYLFL